nr:translation initiation factor IF-2-like [Mirounga angustirostris]
MPPKQRTGPVSSEESSTKAAGSGGRPGRGEGAGGRGGGGRRPRARRSVRGHWRLRRAAPSGPAGARAPNPAPGSAPARSADPPGWPAPHLGRAPRCSLKGPSGSAPPRLPRPARLAPRGAGRSCWRAHPFRPTAAHRPRQAAPGPAAHSPASRGLWRSALRLAGGRRARRAAGRKGAPRVGAGRPGACGLAPWTRVPRGNNWECDGTEQLGARNLGLTPWAIGAAPRNGSRPVLTSTTPAAENVYHLGKSPFLYGTPFPRLDRSACSMLTSSPPIKIRSVGGRTDELCDSQPRCSL